MPGSSSIQLIAEAGVNHNGSIELALKLVEAAARAGANAVKFQSFRAASLVSPTAPKASYQQRSTGPSESQYEMLRRLELDLASHRAIAARCREFGIVFLSTPFDLESLAMLTSEFDVPAIKISSGDLTNAPLLVAAARSAKPVILSTGMGSMDEVEAALAALAFGYVAADAQPSIEAFGEAYASQAGRQAVARQVTLLQCTTEYPARFEELDLRAMESLRLRFGTRVGFSDHSSGIAAAIAAAALGAAVIEKHFTLDRGLPGPDHAASLEPDELNAMVLAVRQVELALGSGEKRPSAAERSNIAAARKSLVAARSVRKGERFSADNLAVMRPGTGVSPMNYWARLGQRADRDYAAGELIDP